MVWAAKVPLRGMLSVLGAGVFIGAPVSCRDGGSCRAVVFRSLCHGQLIESPPLPGLGCSLQDSAAVRSLRFSGSDHIVYSCNCDPFHSRESTK